MSDDTISDEISKQNELDSLHIAGKIAVQNQLSSILKGWIDTVSDNGKIPSKEDLNRQYLPDFNQKLGEYTDQILTSVLLLGMDHAFKNIQAADETIPSIPFSDAVNFLKNKTSITKKEWNLLEPELRFRAFTVAKIAEQDYIESAKNMLVNALNKGDDIDSTWKKIKDLIDTDAMNISPGYWENVYRTNTQTAYTAGKLMAFDKTQPEGIQLFVINDSRTSDICRNLLRESGYGIALPADHQFWKIHGFPPYHYQCRTGFRGVYTTDNIVNPPMSLFNDFQPMDGFGGNPVKTGSWWKMTPGMAERAEKYGVMDSIKTYASDNKISGFIQK